MHPPAINGMAGHLPNCHGVLIWQCVKTLVNSWWTSLNSWDYWMFIPLKMVLIGIDPYPYVSMGMSWKQMKDFPATFHRTPEANSVGLRWTNGHKFEQSWWRTTRPVLLTHVFPLFMAQHDGVQSENGVYLYTHVYPKSTVWRSFSPLNYINWPQLGAHYFQKKNISSNFLHDQTMKILSPPGSSTPKLFNWGCTILVAHHHFWEVSSLLSGIIMELFMGYSRIHGVFIGYLWDMGISIGLKPWDLPSGNLT